MLGLGVAINNSANESALIAGRLPGFTGLLDESYGSGATAAYSVRQLSSSETVAMTIRRDSDNSELDVGFDSEGNLDESAISTFCSGTTCKVSSWRDQSGNRNDATQATAANQPTIYTGGAIVKENGKPAITKSGNISYLDVASFSMTQPYSAIFVAQHLNNTSTRFNAAFSTIDDSVNFDTDSFAGNNSFVMRAGGFLQTTGNRDFVQHLWSTLWNGSSSYAYKDGTLEISGNAGSNNMNSLRLGGLNAFGTLQEFIFYDSDESTDRTSIESNIGDYFTQNTPLLDTYTGAAASYSLRKLRSAYNGSAIRVRRASDNAESDIGFNVFGELSTVELAAHCGSSDGYCVRWYDQSGNANNATQITTANQPKIYDGTTGVITENGKPCMDFASSKFMGLSSAPISDLSSTAVSTFTVCTPPDTTTDGVAYTITDTPAIDNVISLGFNRVTGQYAANRYTNASTSLIITRMWDTHGVNQSLFTVESTGATNLTAYEDSVQATQTSTVSRGNFYNLLGANDTIPNFAFNGTIQEFVIYASNPSRTGVENNINTFYSIY